MTVSAQATEGRELFERILQRLRGGGHFGRNVRYLAGSTLFTQVLTICVAPLLTRIYAPEDVGVLGVVVAFIATAAVLTCGRFDVATVSATSRGDAARLTVVSLLVSLPLTLIATAVFAWLVIRGELGFEIVPRPAIWLASAAVALASVFTALRYWFVREEEMAIVARVTVAQSAVRSVAQLAFGFFSASALSLVAGEALARLVAAVQAAPRALRSLRRTLAETTGTMRDVMRRYRDYPLIALPSAALNTVALHLPIPLLALLFGADAAGQYTIVDRIMAVPLAMISSAVADAFHGRAAAYLRDDPDQVRAFFHRTVKILFLLGVIPLGLIALVGPFTFQRVFGDRWDAVGPMAAIIAPAALAQLTVTPVSRIVLLFKRGLRLKLLYDFATLAIAVGVLFGCHALGWTLMQTLAWFSGAIVLRYLLYYVIMLSLLTTARESRFD